MANTTNGLRFISTAALLCAASIINAAPVTFATFDQANLSQTPWTFTNPAGTASKATFSATAQVIFRFNANIGVIASALGDQAATAVLSLESPGTISPNAANIGLGQIIQPGLDGTLTFTRNSDSANLLTVSFSDAIIGGFNNGNGAAFQASEASAVGQVLFSSGFLTFSPAAADDLVVNLTALSQQLQIAADNQFRSFTATGGGSFSSDPGPHGPEFVPEPASMALLGGGLASLAFAARRRKAL
jgi:hypothetical protein